MLMAAGRLRDTQVLLVVINVFSRDKVSFQILAVEGGKPVYEVVEDLQYTGSFAQMLHLVVIRDAIVTFNFKKRNTLWG